MKSEGLTRWVETGPHLSPDSQVSQQGSACVARDGNSWTLQGLAWAQLGQSGVMTQVPADLPLKNLQARKATSEQQLDLP